MIYPRRHQPPAAVADHYDSLDRWYREIWGEHVHHGLWEKGGERPEEAVVLLSQRVAEALALEPGQDVCDVGCGYGATARLFTSDYDVHVTGYTLSQAQAAYARAAALDAEWPVYHVVDWLDNGLAEASFDAVYSIESSEHFEDKPAFFAEARRLLRPGGKLAVCAWLTAETPSKFAIKHGLEPICFEGCLPGLGSETDYRTLIEESRLNLVRFDDWSNQVWRTWPICAGRMAKRLLHDKEAWRFLMGGPESRVFARSVLRIWLAYRLGWLRYGLFVAGKKLSVVSGQLSGKKKASGVGRPGPS